MNKPTCQVCKRLNISTGYSDTFGEGMGSMGCTLSHWKDGKWGDDESLLHKASRDNQSCPDFDPIDDVKEFYNE